jgi:hypothetical protein
MRSQGCQRRVGAQVLVRLVLHERLKPRSAAGVRASRAPWPLQRDVGQPLLLNDPICPL